MACTPASHAFMRRAANRSSYTPKGLLDRASRIRNIDAGRSAVRQHDRDVDDEHLSIALIPAQVRITVVSL